MITYPRRLSALAAWFVLLIVLAAVTQLVAGPLSPGAAALLLLAAILPPVIAFVVFRGAPPKSISQVLYDEEHAAARVPRLQAVRPNRSRP